MAKWNKVVITDLGKELMANVISGSEIEFTKIKTSDYKFDSDVDLEKVTHIIDVKQEENIKSIEVINNTTVGIYSNFSNKDLTEGYDVRVVGLYAKLKGNESEVLYSITSTDKPDYLPPFNGVTLSSIDYKFVTAIGNSENVILDITEIDSVTKQQFDELQTDVEGLKTTTQSNYDKITILEEANTSHTADLTELKKEIVDNKQATLPLGYPNSIETINSKIGGSIDVKIDGNMVVNLANNGINNSNWTSTDSGSVSIKTDSIDRIAINRDITLKAGTYTLIANVVDHNLDSSYPYIGGYIKQINGTTKYGKMPITNCRDLFVIDDDANEVSLYLHDSLASGKYAKINGVMILEGDWTNKEVPYVESAQPIQNPYVKIKGKNLFDGELDLGIINSVTGENGDRDDRIRSRNYCRVNGGHQVTISIDGKVQKVNIFEFDDSKKFIKYSAGGSNFTLTNDTKYIRFYLEGSESNLNNLYQIEEGTTATEYEPYRESIGIIPTHLAKIGDVKDRVVGIKGTKAVVEREIERIKPDQNYSYSYIGKCDDWKRVDITISDWALESAKPFSICKKYNGKILNYYTNLSSALDSFWIQKDNSTQSLALYLPNADTGWGDSYTPSQEEIKAYFMGWKMYSGNTNPDGGGTYDDDKGNKYWKPILGGGNGTKILPTKTYPEWTPYELFYVLETPHTEEIEMNIIGDSFSLEEGSNTVEVGTGLVLEKANPVLGSDEVYRVNHIPSENKLRFLPKKILGVYKNLSLDLDWEEPSYSSFYYGNVGVYNKYSENFDPQADYYCLYEMIPELYTCGIETAEIIYSENVRDSLNNAVKQIGEISGDVSQLNKEIEDTLIKGDGERIEFIKQILPEVKYGVQCKEILIFNKPFSKQPRVFGFMQQGFGGESRVTLLASKITTTGFDAWAVRFLPDTEHPTKAGTVVMWIIIGK